jgi:hypothetical protein
MSQYLEELRKHIAIFLWHTINRSAQWVNKPKFHILLHLPYSIERFGPACLFSTKNFESFNSLLRQALVHSNRHQPGRDVGLSFINFETMQLILSGARIWNSKKKSISVAGYKVTQIFQDNHQIQKLMGYNRSLLVSADFSPFPMRAPLQHKKPSPIPTDLQQITQGRVSQVWRLQLSQHDILGTGFFVVVHPYASSLIISHLSSSRTNHSISIRLPKVAALTLSWDESSPCGKWNMRIAHTTGFI